MSDLIVVFIVLFLPVVAVTSYVYLAKRKYEKAKVFKKAKYRIRRK